MYKTINNKLYYICQVCGSEHIADSSYLELIGICLKCYIKEN
jgi:hypothetical protein